MKKDLMTKVGELLDLAGLDKEVIKSVTEKLADEDVVLEGEEKMQEEKLEEAACPIKHEEPEKEAEDEKKAPVDPETNEGGYNAVTEEEYQQVLADFQALKEEYAKLVAERVIEESAEEVSEEEISNEAEVEEPTEIEEALGMLLSLVKEAYEQTSAMKSDFETLKEEYAKLVAEKVIAEGCDKCDEIAVEVKGDEEDKAERAKDEEKVKEVEAQEDEEKADKEEAEGKKEEADKEEKKAEKHKKEEAKDKAEEDKDYEKAHESLEETAEQIAESVEEISEEAVETPSRVKIAKAYSAFTNISESVENVKEEKKARKAFTLFPNL